MQNQNPAFAKRAVIDPEGKATIQGRFRQGIGHAHRQRARCVTAQFRNRILLTREVGQQVEDIARDIKDGNRQKSLSD